MTQENVGAKHNTGSVQDPSYSSGEYFTNSRRHWEDANFKSKNFLKLFLRFMEHNQLPINMFIDVGCGSGDIIKIIADTFPEIGFNSVKFKAYDVSPHVQNIKNDGVEYIMGDFSKSDEFADIVTLFDVFEHVPDTIGFIKSISQRCNIIGFHIPLDYSLNLTIRNLFRPQLHNPGHLIFLDIVSALNLLAFSGLRVVDYEYTFGFLAPSSNSTIRSKLIYPLRYILAKINPWLFSKILGGASLMVIAITPNGIREYSTYN